MLKPIVAVIATGASLLSALPISPAAAQTISAEEAALLREEIQRLKSDVARLEQRLSGGAPAPQAAPTGNAPAPTANARNAAATAAPGTRIEWKGSPQFAEDDRSFKVKGRIQADAAYVSVPDGTGDRGLGFSNEVRRIRLGGGGKLGGGIGYKLELEFSDNNVDLVDTFITYENKAWLLAVGNQNQFQSLDELTGDTSGSFMERAAFTDAFNFERRLGISAQHRGKTLLLQAGIFTDDITALSNDSDGPSGGDENNSFGVDGRAVYAPMLGDTRLHLGASAHWRKLNRVSEDPVRYRQRPFVHTTNSRILATPAFNADRELHYGLEVAGIHGPWHFAAETHWLKAFRPAAANPSFFGGYVEVGYFLTAGDTRPYKGGIFGVANPKNPISDGGIGAVQVNLRYDRLDLNSGTIRGGTQDGYLASIIWTPVNYLRLNLNYGYLDYNDAAIAANGRTSYGAHVIGSRIELDF